MSGDVLEQQAKQKLSGMGWFGNKYADAADLFVQAANQFIIDKQMERASEMFEQAYHNYLQAKMEEDAYQVVQSLLKILKKDTAASEQKLVTYSDKLIQHLLQKGRFHMAANFAKQLAEAHHDNSVKIKYFLKAGEWYEQEDAKALGMKCFHSHAMALVADKQYELALAKMEYISSVALSDNLQKYMVKDYLFVALMIAMNLDVLLLNQKLQEYAAMDPSFTQSREYKCIEQLSKALEEGDSEQFSQVLRQYDQLSKLDDMKTNLLLSVKSNMDKETFA
eukprot:NODE_164_length_16443_cov_0.166544.p6 type:complete len:279 gc:universal NODE_164_length_16443_cov_0.166544:4746-5582(+)